MRARSLAALLITALLIAALVAACGSSAASPPSVASPTSVASPPPTLPATAVPYLTSVAKALTPAVLAREAEAPTLVHQLDRWGFEAAADRYFQGESKKLQVVDSRTLRFRGPSGAAAYIAFMRSHLWPYLGPYPRINAFAPGGRHGILAIGQECQCHLANPSFLALVSEGATVTWLEINGPGATPRRLTALIARAP